MTFTTLSIICLNCRTALDHPAKVKRRANVRCLACGAYGQFKAIVVQKEKEPSSSEETLHEVWVQLWAHRNRDHSPEDTFNRLVRKHFEARDPDQVADLPRFRAEDLAARYKRWTTKALAGLWRAHQRNEPAGPLEMPVIVFVFRHEHRLVDGTTRVNRRARGDISDTHPVIVVSWRGKNDSTVLRLNSE